MTAHQELRVTMTQDMPDNVRRAIRRDSHLALGCGFAFALLVVSALIIYLLAAA